MNVTTEKSILEQMPVAHVAFSTFTKSLATWMLAAGVAALVVVADQLIEDWAQTHAVAAWLALWVVAMLAIGALRGASRLLAHNVVTGLDAWSAHVARRRADQRLWDMAQSDSRLMKDLQLAMDRSEEAQTSVHSPAADLTTFVALRTPRMLNNSCYYI
jgi:hypothetical protein